MRSPGFIAADIPRRVDLKPCRLNPSSRVVAKMSGPPTTIQSVNVVTSFRDANVKYRAPGRASGVSEHFADLERRRERRFEQRGRRRARRQVTARMKQAEAPGKRHHWPAKLAPNSTLANPVRRISRGVRCEEVHGCPDG